VRSRDDLHEPQRLGAAFALKRPRCNLFMPMGFGKTAAALTVVSDLAYDRPVLVLGPLRVARKVWGDEAAEWEHLSHLKVATITGSPDERRAALATRAHVHTMNYENIAWLLNEIPEVRWPFKMVIADESTRLKGFRLKQGARRAGALATIALRAERWINMTGTPAAQGLLDLWGPQWFIDQGAALCPSFSAFESRWFYKPPRGGTAKGHTGVKPFPAAQGEINALLAPTSLAMRVEDYFDVAEPVVSVVRVDLPEPARREYKRMARDLWAQIQDKVITAANAGVKSLKLAQLASGAIYHDEKRWAAVHDEKLEALASIVNETGGEPLVVQYAFVHERIRIMKAFPQARELLTTKDEDDWNAGRIPMLVVHPKSMGHGLSLQHGGRILVRFADTWSHEQHLQILERIGPMRQLQSGYNRSVLVYDIRARDTVDEVIPLTHAGNLSVMDALLDHLSRV
jgi:SNF2-related domain